MKTRQNGVALLIVLTTVTLLTFIVMEFSYLSKLNRIKVLNQQDKAQARLNALAGIRFSLAKLRLYKEGSNLLEKNDGLKDVISSSELQSIITQPFMYPIPDLPGLSLIQKNAINDFQKDALVRGKISVSISPVSGFLNPNNLRMQKQSTDQDNKNPDETDANNSEKKSKGDKDEIGPDAYIEQQLVETLKNAIEQKKEEDDGFNALYSNLSPELLVKELKFYVSDSNKYEEPEKAEFEQRYRNKNIIPKHAPLNSISELYLLDGWDDAIINLIKDKLSVHEVSIIPLNEITDSQLKVIFPDITKDQLVEFFAFRDGTVDKSGDKIPGRPFKSARDFKDLVVNRLGILDESSYEKRIQTFAKAGLQFGVAGKLFKVVSTGEFERAIYTLTAYIDLPIKPQPPAKKQNTKNDANNNNETLAETPPSEEKNPTDGKNKKTQKQPQELLEPRVVEMIIN